MPNSVPPPCTASASQSQVGRSSGPSLPMQNATSRETAVFKFEFGIEGKRVRPGIVDIPVNTYSTPSHIGGCTHPTAHSNLRNVRLLRSRNSDDVRPGCAPSSRVMLKFDFSVRELGCAMTAVCKMIAVSPKQQLGWRPGSNAAPATKPGNSQRWPPMRVVLSYQTRRRPLMRVVHWWCMEAFSGISRGGHHKLLRVENRYHFANSWKRPGKLVQHLWERKTQ